MASLVIFRFETFCLSLGDDMDDKDNMRSMGDSEDDGMMLGDVKIFIYFWLMMGDINITFGTLGSCILDTHCHRFLGNYYKYCNNK
jgi:hypothetical protein